MERDVPIRYADNPAVPDTVLARVAVARKSNRRKINVFRPAELEKRTKGRKDGRVDKKKKKTKKGERQREPVKEPSRGRRDFRAIRSVRECGRRERGAFVHAMVFQLDFTGGKYGQRSGQ